jgi:hypothetical protein
LEGRHAVLVDMEHDDGYDQHRMEGKQVVTIDGEGYRETFAVYLNWDVPDISRYIAKLFCFPRTRSAQLRKIKDGEYVWSLEEGANLKKFKIGLGTKVFETVLEGSNADVMGEWLSRMIGQIIPPFPQC